MRRADSIRWKQLCANKFLFHTVLCLNICKRDCQLCGNPVIRLDYTGHFYHAI